MNRLIVAGILHDVVEDTPVTIEEVASRFDKRVAELVAGASEQVKLNKTESGDTSWRSRKKHTLEHLENSPDIDSLLVSCADKLDNAQAIKHDLLKDGDTFWSRFNAGKEDQYWYYKSLTDILLKRGLEAGNPLLSMAKELEKVVAEIFPKPL